MTAIATLQLYAADGIVYRAFDHAVVAAMGLVRGDAEAYPN